MPHTRAWAMARKARTLTTTNASGCRAYSSWAAETKSWKSRSKMELTASFQLVENVLNSFCLVSFLKNNHFLKQANGTEFCISSYLCPALCTWAWSLLGYYSTKIINCSQFKSQNDFNTVKWRNKAVKVEFRCAILSIKKAMVHSTSIIFFNLFTAKW